MRRLTNAINFRFRLTLIFALTFGLTTIFFNMVVFSYVIDALKHDFDDALYNYCVDISNSLEEKILKGDVENTPLQIEHGKNLPFSSGTSFLLLKHRDGRLISQFGNLGTFVPPFTSEVEKIDLGVDSAYRTLTNISKLPNPEADSYRLITFPIENKKSRYFLQVIVPRTFLETQIENRLVVIQFGIPLVIVFSMAMGYYLAGRALLPIKKIIETTKRINANVLSDRVPVPSNRDEFKVLALTINQMLERIEQSFQSQEKFIADASHQLLSPLTILKSSIEHFKKKSDSTKLDDFDVFLNSQQVEIDNLTQIIKDMLLLARMDAGKEAFRFSQINLEELIFDVINLLEKIARKKNIRIKLTINDNNITEHPQVFADSDLLRHLFFNLIENAIKYSPKSSQVEVEISWRKESTKIFIRDHGPGIPKDQIDYIFERFSRVPQTSNVQGFGLGLAIAKKIAKLHSANLNVINRNGNGAEFQFEIKNI